MKLKNQIILWTDSDMVDIGMEAVLDDIDGFEVINRVRQYEYARRAMDHNPDAILVMMPQMLNYSQRNQVAHLFPQRIVVALVCHFVESAQLPQYSAVINLTDTKSRIDSVLHELVYDDKSSALVDEQEIELSQREQEVLLLITKGKSNKVIAEELNLSIHTVMTHRRNIMSKTGVKSVAGLAVYALLNNLVAEEEIINT